MSPSNISSAGGPRLVRTAVALAFVAASDSPIINLPHSCETVSIIWCYKWLVGLLTVSTLKKIHNQPVNGLVDHTC